MKYSKEFKEEAIKLSDEIGLKKTAHQLGIQYYTLSNWRSKRNAAIKAKKYQIPTYKMKREEVKSVIFRYIFGYYNTHRINSFNKGGLQPVALRTAMQLPHHAA